MDKTDEKPSADRVDAANAARKAAEIRSETGKATVTVALKHPTGIKLEVFGKISKIVPIGGGVMREEESHQAVGPGYVLNGSRVSFGLAPRCEVINGYALTHGIPQDVWETWKSQHADSPIVENDLIYAHPNAERVKDWARDKDHAARRSGLEALLQKDDPRVPKQIQKGTLVGEESVFQ